MYITENKLICMENMFSQDSEAPVGSLLLYFMQMLATRELTNDILTALKIEIFQKDDYFEIIMLFRYMDIKYPPVNKEYGDNLYNEMFSIIVSELDHRTLYQKYYEFIKKSYIILGNSFLNYYNLLNDYSGTPLVVNYCILKDYSPCNLIIDTEKITKRYIPHDFWCNNCGYSRQACNLIKAQLKIDLHPVEKDYYEIFRPCLSYVEVELTCKTIKTMLIHVFYLEDLCNGCIKYKKFWYEMQIIDKSGSIIL